MVITQQVRSAWLYKEDFSQEDWARLLDKFDVDEDIRCRTFAIDVRVDTTCQKAEGRYYVFRSDGYVYDSWEATIPLADCNIH